MKTLLILSLLTLSACTGTSLQVTPETPAPVVTKPLSMVGIEDRTTKSLPEAGDMADGFARALRNQRAAEEVYYPQRPKDPIDTTLETRFTSEVDPHMGSLFLKSIVVGLTLFLAEPFIWYPFDYTLTADVDVIKDGKHVKRVTGKVDATIEAKWLSLGETKALQDKALEQAKASLYHQLIAGVAK